MMAAPECSNVVVRREEPQTIAINVRGSERAVCALSCEHEAHIKLTLIVLMWRIG